MEQVLFQSPAFTVTTARLVARGATYSIAHIASIHAAKADQGKPPSRAWGPVGLGGCAVLVVAGLVGSSLVGDPDWGGVAFAACATPGLALGVFGALSLRKPKPMPALYNVLISSTDGGGVHFDRITEEEARSVVESVNRALAMRA